MHISPSHTTHTLSVLSSSGIYRILIIMELETDKTYAHVMGLSAEVLHLYLNQANLTTSGNKRALVERMLDNAIIHSNAPFKGESGKNPAGQNGTQNEDEPAGQALQSIILASIRGRGSPNNSSVSRSRHHYISINDVVKLLYGHGPGL